MGSSVVHKNTVASQIFSAYQINWRNHNNVRIDDQFWNLDNEPLREYRILEVLFSLLLTRKIGRPITFIAALMTTATLLFTPPSDPDDLFFLLIELVAILAILRTAWIWIEDAPAQA